MRMDIKDIQEQAYQRGLEEGRSQGLLEQELKHRMAAFCDVSCIRIISCEDSTVHYLDFPDGLRLISHEGKYVGWYACDGHDAPDFKQREKLVVLIGEIQDEGVDYAECFRDGDRPGYISNYVLADHLIANGVTVQEWIPVTEMLPKIYDKDPDWSETVLFRTVGGHIHSGYSKHEAVEIRTNGDRIRAMSDEELAAYFGQYTLCTQIQDKHSGWCDAQPVCSGCLVEWLKQPA